MTLGAPDNLYDKIMAEDGVIAKVEGVPGFFVTGHMADISMRAKLRGLKDTTGQPLFKSDMQSDTRYSLDGLQMTFPNNGSFDKSKALMISGDFLTAGLFDPAGYYIQAVYRGCCAGTRMDPLLTT